MPMSKELAQARGLFLEGLGQPAFVEAYDVFIGRQTCNHDRAARIVAYFMVRAGHPTMDRCTQCWPVPCSKDSPGAEVVKSYPEETGGRVDVISGYICTSSDLSVRLPACRAYQRASAVSRWDAPDAEVSVAVTSARAGPAADRRRLTVLHAGLPDDWDRSTLAAGAPRTACSLRTSDHVRPTRADERVGEPSHGESPYRARNVAGWVYCWAKRRS
jgi:hypothetical protein